MSLQLDHSDREAVAGRLPIGVLTLAATAVILGLLLAIGVQNNRAQFAQAQLRVVDQARTLAEHTARTFGAGQLILRQFVRHIESQQQTIAGPALDIRAMLDSASSDLPHISSMLFLDASGSSIGAALPPGETPADLARRPFFQVHRASDTGGLFVGAPVADAAGGWTIALSLPITAPSGEFGGVVAALIDPLYFRAFYNDIGQPDGLGSALLSTTGQIMSSSGGYAGIDGEVMGMAVADDNMATSSAVPMAFVGRLLPGGTEQLAASARVAGWPLLVVANVDRSEVAARSHGVSLGLLGAAILVVVAAIAIYTVLRRTIDRQRRAMELVEDSRSELSNHVLDLQQSRAQLESQGAQLAGMAEQLAEAKLTADHANRAKTDFLAHMSHELRTPLNAILGFSEVVRDEMFGPIGNATYADYAGSIHTSGRHLLEIINDILDLSKIEAGKFELEDEDVRVADVVSDVIRLVRDRARTSELTLAVEVSDEHLLHADKRAMKQMLINLVANAIKFTPAGGTITVRGVAGESGYALSVADSGIGIKSEDIAQVLAPFGQVTEATRTKGGTGLGVPIVRSLIELHGGSLAVESEPGSGSTFTLRFPAARTVDNAAVAAIVA